MVPQQAWARATQGAGAGPPCAGVWQSLASDLRALRARSPSFLVCEGADCRDRAPDPRVPHKVKVTRDWDVAFGIVVRYRKLTRPSLGGNGIFGEDAESSFHQILGKARGPVGLREGWTRSLALRGSRSLPSLLPVHSVTVASSSQAGFLSWSPHGCGQPITHPATACSQGSSLKRKFYLPYLVPMPIPGLMD